MDAMTTMWKLDGYTVVNATLTLSISIVNVHAYHTFMMQSSGMLTSRMEYVEAEEEDTDRILLFILLKV